MLTAQVNLWLYKEYPENDSFDVWYIPNFLEYRI
jgi:hypothetical protein